MAKAILKRGYYMKNLKRAFFILGMLVSTALNTYATPIEKLPIVYSKNYNISFLGIENLHPFDSKKYGKIANYLSTYLHVPIKNLFH